MSANVPNQVPFLRTTRTFPEDPQALSVEISKSYLDIANVVNSRIIGIFGNVPTVTGESWYFSGGSLRQQTLRKAFQFSDSSLTFNHGINLTNVKSFTRIWGTFFDGTSWQTLPYTDVVSATNQINVRVTSTQVIVTKGGGAPPAVSNGIIVIEYLSTP